MTFKTYKRYLEFTKIPFYFTLLVLSFVLSECVFTFFYYILGKYDEYKEDGESETNTAFIILTILAVGYLVSCIIKYNFCQNGVLKSNQNIYMGMLHVKKYIYIYISPLPF